MKKVRCAIYTRKSSEEGLEQDFNSLHAQREACAAYIMSQASEGWHLVPDEYDDGGISGGTLERPGLTRLLADIAAKKIDIVVVYKVDRLTRSLLDFSKLVEAFDKAEVSFVSVTQSFNTTTSMGRLTLNMLLSFAQFEREVTAERIRDKIAASKARGMWMGGVPPIGYRADGRSLAIVEEHAAIIRRVFDRYLALGCVRLLVDEFAADGIVAPARCTNSGRQIGDRALSRGQIYKLLSNPIYVGEIHHRGQVHKANHEPIIDRSTWEAVQLALIENTQGQRGGSRAQAPSLLAGRLFDENGEAVVASHTSKPAKVGADGGKLRYRYYVSKALQFGADTDSGMRIPARELEGAVAHRIAEALDDHWSLLGSAGLTIQTNQAKVAAATAEELAVALRGRDRSLVEQLVERVVVTPSELQIEISSRKLASALSLPVADPSEAIVTLTSNVRITRTGLAVRLVHTDGRSASGTPDQHLLKLLAQARQWAARLATGEIDIANLARAEGVNDSWMTRVARLNYLAPKVVEAIIAGQQPARLTATTILTMEIPVEWDQQVEMLLAA